MAAYDHGIKLIAEQAGRQLARLAGIECSSWHPAESTVQATVEKLADRAFLATSAGERFIVYFEFYTAWKRDAVWDILAKSAMLSARERLPTWTVAVVLSRQGYKPQRGRFRLAVGGTTTQAVRFKEVPLWKLKPQTWWEKSPGLMALFPLCRHGLKPPEAVGRAASVIEKRVTGVSERADVLVLLGIFSKLGYPDLDTLSIIGREKMKESKFFEEVREEGKQEGKIEMSRAGILKAIETRFGAPARKKVAARVNAIGELTELDHLFDAALRCADLDEFRSALPQA